MAGKECVCVCVWGTNGDAYVVDVVPSVAYEEGGATTVFS